MDPRSPYSADGFLEARYCCFFYIGHQKVASACFYDASIRFSLIFPKYWLLDVVLHRVLPLSVLLDLAVSL